MFRFIHASDLHLGNTGPSTIGLSKSWSDRISTAAYKAFDKLIDKAIELDVDCILLAGDTLDTSTPTLRSQLELYKGLTRLSQANIKVFMVGGNHDPLNLKRAQSELPDGVHLFGQSPEKIPLMKDGRKVAEITGVSYQFPRVTEDLSTMFIPGGEGFQIALLHTNLSGYGKKDNYAPSKLENLIASGFDYWALGHVHQNMVLNKNPYIVYSGTTQGQHINEVGPKGFYLVEVGDSANDVKLQFISTSVYLFEHLEVVAPSSINELQSILGGLESNTIAESIYRLTVKGRTPMYTELINQAEELETRYKEGMNYVLESLVLEIFPDVDYLQVKNEDSLAGEFVREALLLIEKGLDKEAQEVLDPLYKNSRFGDVLETLDNTELELIVKGSIALGLDLFWRGESS